jgi:RNA polymerase sigma-70 factor (ECF subfamily)
MARLRRTKDIDDTTRRFETFFRFNYQRVVSYVSWRVPRSRVDDVVAATFVVAWKKFASVDSPSLPWLLRIASFEIRSSDRAMRRAGITVAVNENVARPDLDDFDGVQVLAALSRLSTSDQELLRLIHWDDLTRSEAAQMLGVTVNALNVRYHRALERLEQQMLPITLNPSPRGAKND